MVVNKIDARPFEVEAFKQQLTEASFSRSTDHVVAQVSYLARYCSWLEAKTVIREDHYIDRHFLDEHALYYSRNLQPPPNFVRRFHLFARSISERQLDKLFEKRAAVSTDVEKAKRLERELSRDYLGFISIRPVPSVPVGRTILRCLDDGAPRSPTLSAMPWRRSSGRKHLISAWRCSTSERGAFCRGSAPWPGQTSVRSCAASRSRDGVESCGGSSMRGPGRVRVRHDGHPPGYTSTWRRADQGRRLP